MKSCVSIILFLMSCMDVTAQPKSLPYPSDITHEDLVRSIGRAMFAGRACLSIGIDLPWVSAILRSAGILDEDITKGGKYYNVLIEGNKQAIAEANNNYDKFCDVSMENYGTSGKVLRSVLRPGSSILK